MQANVEVVTFSSWKLIATAILVIINGYFVAAEFALVKVRPARIAVNARKGSRSAQAVMRILNNLNLYLSGCQLGITLASLALGWLAEPAIASLILVVAERFGFTVADNQALHVISLVIALSVVTILHITIGEQAPKVYAIQKAEKMASLVAYPLIVFTTLFSPFIWFINAISNALLRMVGLRDADPHGESHDVDELRTILGSASRAGHISGRQKMFGENILGLVRLEVRHVMLPRIDVEFLSTAVPLEENLKKISQSGHTRFALCKPDLDNVLGVVHGKDLLVQLLSKDKIQDLADHSRPMHNVPDTLPLSKYILEAQKAQRQCALVVDEHGTSVGMVFLEDALEEIVGPLNDEFDETTLRIEELQDGGFAMAGRVPLPEASHLLDYELGDEEDTVGGFVTALMGRLPKTGEKVEFGSYQATVLEMSRRRVARVEFRLLDKSST